MRQSGVMQSKEHRTAISAASGELDYSMFQKDVLASFSLCYRFRSIASVVCVGILAFSSALLYQ